MNKILLKSTVLLTTALIVGPIIASEADAASTGGDYTSNGYVNFAEGDNTGINPVDPLDPSVPVGPTNPDGTDPTPGTGGALSIDFASSLSFGTQKISSKDATYFAHAQWISKDKDGSAVDMTRPNYVQVTDTRGTWDGHHIGLSGFTPAGTAKAVTAALAKIAEAEHEKGEYVLVSVFTGASTGDSCDGILSRAKAIRYRAPYTTNVDFRKAVNNGEIAYNDIHLSQMAQEVRYGFMGNVDIAIIEACEVTADGKIYLTAAGGIAPTICRLADKIIVELNAAHSKSAMGLHDVYEPLDPPYRREISIFKPSDRIGKPYIQVDPKKIVGVVETNWPDEARSFAAADPLTDKIGQNVADFLAADMKRGIIPSTFLPLQSGVGNIANAVLGALGRDKTIPAFEMYTEVIQNSVIGLIREGRVKFGSAC